MHDETKWTILDVILVFVFLIILMGITSSYAPRINNILNHRQFLGMSPKVTLFFLVALLQSVYLITIIGIIARIRKISFREIGFSTQNFGQSLYFGIGGGVALFTMVVFLGILVTVVTKTVPPPQEVATFLMEMEGLWPRILAFFLSSVMAPFSEELYFRGMVYPVLRGKVGRTAAIILSGIFFSLAHRDFYRFIPITAGGIGLALLFDKTRSLWTSVIAHSTWNAIMLLLMISSSRFTP